MTRDPDRPVREAWIVDAVRTPIGRYGGALASIRPDDLAALVVRSVVDRAGIDPAVIEDVILGRANQGEQYDEFEGIAGRHIANLSHRSGAGWRSYCQDRRAPSRP